MNQRLQSFARETLRNDCYQFTPEQQITFKLMYGRNKGQRTIKEAKALPINQVIDEIPAKDLDWAMQQSERTLVENRKKVTSQ